jgi:Putative Ig domain
MRVDLDRGCAVATRTIIAWLLVLLAGCGGSDQEPVIPARAGAADIDASGGTVDAVLEGGATVELVVPAGALSTNTTFHLDPVAAPAGTLGAIQIAPAGLQFRAPVTLVVTLPSSGATAATTGIALAIGTTQVPLGAQLDATNRRLSVALSSLGTGSAEPFATAAAVDGSRKRVAASVSDQAVAIILTTFGYDDIIAAMQSLVANLSSDGSRDNARIVGTMMDGVLRLPQANADPRVRAAVATWRSVVCSQQQFAVSALNTFNVASDYEGFVRRAGDALIFGQAAEQLGQDVALLSNPSEPGCSNLPASFEQPVRARFPAFLASARQALGLLDPTGDFHQILTVRIPELLDFAASLAADSALDDMVASVEALVADQTVRLRSGAYAACRSGHVQEQQRDLLAAEVEVPTFGPVSPYDADDLIGDIENCGMPIHWALLAADSSVLRQGEAGGIAAGSIVNAVPLTLSGAAKLVLSGPLSALRCPSGSQNNEQLVFSAGPAKGAASVVGQLTPSSDSGYLEASDLEIPVAQLLTSAQPSGPPASGQLVIGRQGGTCNGEFPSLNQHTTLVTFALNFGGVQITTTSLPAATIGTGYVAVLTASGGTLPLTWSAQGLPPGLHLDAQTGTISGTVTSAGSANVTVSVTSADGSSSQLHLVLPVISSALPAGQWSLNVHVVPGPSTINNQFFIPGVLLNLTPGQLGGSFNGTTVGAFFLTFHGTFTSAATVDAKGNAALSAVTILLQWDNPGRPCQDTIQIGGPVVANNKGFDTRDANDIDVVQIPTCLNNGSVYTGFDASFFAPLAAGSGGSRVGSVSASRRARSSPPTPDPVSGSL